MCGIAGYNVKPTWAAKRMSEEMLAELLRIAWEYNLHRGTDAAGFFNVAGDTTYHWKQGGSALKLLEENEIQIPEKSHVFAAHTRASTIGPPKDNENNHPVMHGRVMVTHNGHISNHTELRKGILPRPLVDSHAIAVILDAVENPENLEEVMGALAQLSGGYAIHAVWSDHPGLSLLAKGLNSPLVVRYNKDVGVFYSSEVDTSWHMIDALNAKPLGTHWKVADMDDFSAMLIKDGAPIAWGTFVPAASSGSNFTGPWKTTRLLPDGRPIYSTDWVRDFASNGNKFADETADLSAVYGREFGFLGKEEKVSLPFGSDTRVLSRLAEADEMYYGHEDTRIYAQFGEVEVILEKTTGKLIDVINHANEGERYKRELSADYNDPNVTYANFNEFIDKCSTWVKDCKGFEEPTYKIVESRRNMGGVPLLPMGATVSTTTTDGTTDLTRMYAPFSDDYDDDDLEVGEIVTRQNWNGLWSHKSDETFKFRHDVKCVQHQSDFVMHDKVMECDDAVHNALEVMACFESPDLFMKIDSDCQISLHLEENPCAGPCDWVLRFIRTIEFDGKKYGMPSGEECSVCGSTRWLTVLPGWVQRLYSLQMELLHVE